MTDSPVRRPPIRPPLARRLREAARGAAFGFVWIAAAIGAFYLYQVSPESQSARAVAETIEHRIAPAASGRVVDVPVALGETVRAGDLIAVLDATPITEELAILSAELELRNAEFAAKAATLGRNRLTEERSFAAAIDAAEIALLQARVGRDAVRAELTSVRAQERRQRELVARRMADREDLDRLEAERQVLGRRAELLEQTVQGLERTRTEALDRLEAFRAAAPPEADDPASTAALAPDRAAIAIAQARLRELEARRSRLFLRAPADGVVHRVLVRSGDVATAGEPIAVLRGIAPHRVLAYVDDVRAEQLYLGSQVLIRDRSGRPRERKGFVASLGAGLTLYPEQLQSTPERPLWGRELVIELDDPGAAAPLVPGQVLDVTFVPVDTSTAVRATASPGDGRTASTVAPGDAPLEPHATGVPPALRRLTRVEPSAIVWSKAHSRFLVASDDTGYPDADDHAPWLLLFTAAGQFAPDPLRVDNLPALNDVESMAWWRDGRLLLLSSQSTSRRGRRPQNRTLLVAAKPEDMRLRADSAVSLSAAIAEHVDPAWRAGLGLSAESSEVDPRLDIEGMAVLGDALLLGLKEPLDPSGCAIVWRLAEPDRLLTTGHIEPGQLTRRACLRLDTDSRGGHEFGGVSDLLLLPDGSLVILSSDVPAPRPPGAQADAAAGDLPPGGAAWLIVAKELDAETSAATPIVPHLLRRFEGMRPEGVALAPDGNHLIIVFDRGEETPFFSTLPLPTAGGDVRPGGRDTLASQ